MWLKATPTISGMSIIYKWERLQAAIFISKCSAQLLNVDKNKCKIHPGGQHTYRAKYEALDQKKSSSVAQTR
jgi:hypothetical protein